jgi:hypothetical protein
MLPAAIEIGASMARSTQKPSPEGDPVRENASVIAPAKAMPTPSVLPKDMRSNPTGAAIRQVSGVGNA